MKKLLVFASATALFVGCTRSPRDVQLSVVNESATTLTNTVVVGAGFSTPLGTLVPGAKQQIPLQSDTGAFQLQFDANGRHFAEPSAKEPWKGMKEVIMTVTTNLSVDTVSVTTF